MNKGRLGLRENKMNTFKGWEEEKQTNTNKKRVKSMLKERTQLGGGPIERLKGEHYEQEKGGFKKEKCEHGQEEGHAQEGKRKMNMNMKGLRRKEGEH